jgi:hypothetical protein
MATRLAHLEAEQEAATRAWLAGLSDDELGALVDEAYGAGTWQWLCATSDMLTLEEIERPGYLWGLYAQWRRAQP